MKSNKKPLNKIDSNQSGIVSIIVTLVVMIVISLLVLSYARISRRNQQEALDRQLSTQAFYAAETAVNDATKTFDTNNNLNPLNPSMIDYTKDCNGPNSFINAASLATVLDATAGVKYSCLLVDPTPSTVEFTSLGSDSKAVPIKSKDSSNISTITVAWQDKDGATDFTCGSSGTFPENSTTSPWPCTTGVLRVDLVPTNNATRSSLNSSVKTVFFFPGTSGGSTFNFATDASGSIIPVNCSTNNTPKYCVATINIGAGATNQYYIRTKTIYGTSAITIKPTNTAGSSVELVGAQAVIDATGKASDVLRRIQVRISLTGGTTTIPEFALQSDDTICKRLIVMNGTATAGDADPKCSP